MTRVYAAYALAVGAMASIAYGCWLWNESLGLVVGGVMTLLSAVEVKGRG